MNIIIELTNIKSMIPQKKQKAIILNAFNYLSCSV